MGNTGDIYRGHTAHKGQRKLIFVSGFNNDPKMLEATFELAREWEWELRGPWIPQKEWLLDRSLAGALITELPTAPLAQHLREIGCPAVRLGVRPHPDDDLLPAVLPDQMASGCLAAEHFASRCFKQVAYVGYEPDDPAANTHATYKAFRQRAGDLGMACHVLSIRSLKSAHEQNGDAQRARGLANWVDHLPKPVGILCFNDIMTERVGLACVKKGLSIPEDVALLGQGNSLACEISPVPLSSVDLDLTERVHVAMRLLRRMMDGEPPPTEPVMVSPSGIVERQSTNVLAVPDPAVARALRYMWDHLDLDLSVDDIACQAGVPRYRLERGFRTHLNRGVNAELRRRRLEVFRDMLVSTDTPISELAPQVGFYTMVHLRRSFRRAYGMSAREYRAKGSKG